MRAATRKARFMSRPSWGHVSRHCIRCGKVGPRVIVAGGYIHAYCRTLEELRRERKLRRDVRKRDLADLKAQFEADKARYFPEPPEVLE